MDVSLEESVKSGVEHMVKSFGRIDYCVHSAGVSVVWTSLALFFVFFCSRISTKITIQSSNPVATSFSEFQLLDRVNVHGTFLVTKAVAAAMALQEPKPVDTSSPERGIVRGSIVNMASIAAVITPPSMVQYISAKFAVNGITKSAGTYPSSNLCGDRCAV